MRIISPADSFTWLSDWLLKRCDGRWEHEFGVHISTTDVPGWIVRIDLKGTEWETRADRVLVEEGIFPPLALNAHADDASWIQCMIVEGRFEGAGAPEGLEEILMYFRSWIEQPDSSPRAVPAAFGGGDRDDLQWLQKWYSLLARTNRKESQAITLTSIDNPGWWLKIDLRGTKYEHLVKDGELVRVGEPPGPENGNQGGRDWMLCRMLQKRFDSAGDTTKLTAIIQVFRKLIEGTQVSRE